MGKIFIAQEFDDSYTFAWEGDDDVTISAQLLEHADPRVISARHPGPGELFTVGPYTLRAVAYDEAGTLQARRVEREA